MQIQAWAAEVNKVLHDSAGGRMISEWAKKPECWEAVRGRRTQTRCRGFPRFVELSEDAPAGCPTWHQVRNPDSALCTRRAPTGHVLCIGYSRDRQADQSVPGRSSTGLREGTGLDGAVNKRFLSTGETGELVLENVGFGLNPGVELAPPRRLLSNWRDRPACENLRNVADAGYGGARRCRQDNGRGIWDADSVAPQETRYKTTSPVRILAQIRGRKTSQKHLSQSGSVEAGQIRRPIPASRRTCAPRCNVQHLPGSLRSPPTRRMPRLILK